MTRRTQMAYEALFEEVLNFTADMGLALNPKTVSTDFELAAINAIRSLLPLLDVHGCLFHLCQSVCRRVQHLGLSVLNKNGVGGFAIKVRQLAALSFLPIKEVRDAYASLKPLFPQEYSALLQWWEDNYLLGKSRRRVTEGNTAVIIRAPSVLMPSLWNVLALAQNRFPRGNNAVEAWHQRWEIVGGFPPQIITSVLEGPLKEVKCRGPKANGHLDSAR
ncbi:hypothetical protein HPB49_004358 [Dermacentor silvarum]|uniref:Uncharacterized protein n=1 Tax=Dermacentor silvarum TaxID=543639 RepID=A0ACB8DUK1_DERSI|nr:hypothetical protein HPB49_004358 [Dermacentor silvarum]